VIFAKTILLWDDTFIALTGVLSFIGGTIPGSVIGGVIADKLGRKKTLYIFLIILLIVSAFPIFAFDVSTLIYVEVYIILTWAVALSFGWSGMTAANWAMMMDIINPKIGATQHEIICSIGNFGDTVISAAAGALFILIGFNNIFLLASIFIIIALPILYKIQSDKIK
jgi:MFS family permease